MYFLLHLTGMCVLWANLCETFAFGVFVRCYVVCVQCEWVKYMLYGCMRGCAAESCRFCIMANTFYGITCDVEHNWLIFAGNGNLIQLMWCDAICGSCMIVAFVGCVLKCRHSGFMTHSTMGKVTYARANLMFFTGLGRRRYQEQHSYNHLYWNINKSRAMRASKYHSWITDLMCIANSQLDVKLCLSLRCTCLIRKAVLIVWVLSVVSNETIGYPIRKRAEFLRKSDNKQSISIGASTCANPFICNYDINIAVYADINFKWALNGDKVNTNCALSANSNVS